MDPQKSLGGPQVKNLWTTPFAARNCSDPVDVLIVGFASAFAIKKILSSITVSFFVTGGTNNSKNGISIALRGKNFKLNQDANDNIKSKFKTKRFFC